MKKNWLLFLYLGLTLSSALHAQCKAKDLVKKYKPNLKPYNYDGYTENQFTFKDQPQTVEVEFTAFAGQHYRLVFCSAGFQEEVKVNIYDKSKRNPKRQKVFDSNQGIDNLFWMFEPPKTGTYFIEYEIPAGAKNDMGKIGCLVLMIGFKN
jgi:hypothetical protein